MQNREEFSSTTLTRQIQNLSVELQQHFSEFFSSEQTQVENERLRLEHQRRIDAANQIVQKQELDRNQWFKQLNQTDTEIRNDSNTSEKFKL